MGAELKRLPDIGETVLVDGKTAIINHMAMGIVTLSVGTREIAVRENRIIQDTLEGTWKLATQTTN